MGAISGMFTLLIGLFIIMIGVTLPAYFPPMESFVVVICGIIMILISVTLFQYDDGEE